MHVFLTNAPVNVTQSTCSMNIEGKPKQSRNYQLNAARATSLLEELLRTLGNSLSSKIYLPIHKLR